MDTNRWNKIKQIFNDSCECAPEEKRSFVRDACGDDAELEQAVLNLINADKRSYTLLDEIPDYTDDELIDTAVSKQIGPYKVLKELGRGGMGVVYLVERADKQYQKKMALKLVKRGMDTDEILYRFRSERQILASLEHPNIARLYDGGATEDGSPYLVMEYIEGEPITTYCDNGKLTIDERLQLFTKICKGVQFAHQNLIVHRDLKPSNVMVTNNGDVRLLDFGIAKLLQDPADQERAYTQPWARRISPRYASPEQFSGKRITTASDVYSLGIILYELLTGTHPYNDDAGKNTFGLPDIPRNIESPVSRVQKTDNVEIFHTRQTTKSSLSRRIRNDISMIVLTALHPDPHLRYQSAEQLLRDIERHLSGHPVGAHPPSPLYRFKKFIARNRAVTASIVIIFSITMLFSIFFWMQSERIALERDAVKIERDKAIKLAGFLNGLFDAANPFNPTTERIDTLRAAELLKRGAERVHAELTGQPVIRSQMLRSIGLAYQGMGLYDEAHSYLSDALEIRKNIDGIDPNELIESYTDKGFLLYINGEYKESESLLREALILTETLPNISMKEKANVMHTLGITLIMIPEREEAESLLRGALFMRKEIFGNEHQEIAATLGALGTVLDDMGKFDEAEEVLQETVQLRESLYGNDHPSVAIGYNNLANHYREVGKLEQAENAIREAIRINRSVLGNDHLYVAQNLQLLGSILRFKGDYENAEKILEETLELYRQYHPDNHSAISVALFAYAGLHLTTGRLDTAEDAIRESLQMLWLQGEELDYPIAVNLQRLGTILYRKGDLARSLETYARAIRIFEVIVPATDNRLISAKRMTAMIQLDLGDFTSAESILKDIYSDLQATRSEDDTLVQQTLADLVQLYQAVGDEEKASYYSGLLQQH